MRIRRIFGLVCIVLIVLLVLEQIPGVQRFTAANVSRIYVYFTYGHDKLFFEKIEYVPQFGDYFVTYENKLGEKYSFIVSPRFFPVLVKYDPIKKEAVGYDRFQYGKLE
ncbi:hypothetical protein VQ056_06720 [Paenibacillus sp. JTLBN-2024]|uniref:DUF3139 domain-containing protein n=1 Tax=Paenibacillus cookii TaxID=157839 RepID=A0ABQ4LVG6_9BACL|nr:hypothetical protein [Paenibacillus cookii]KHF31430.1 hypothetical protein CM49_06349 [Paenibacillus sp. P1XP2]GIO67272.1 hypothetical protein J21TS3_20930 [Paenibacillus cookii]HWO53856.1 hypothetical protein [Paenibacillus cookii]